MGTFRKRIHPIAKFHDVKAIVRYFQCGGSKEGNRLLYDEPVHVARGRGVHTNCFHDAPEITASLENCSHAWQALFTNAASQFGTRVVVSGGNSC
jgi:hypothetical protein